MLREAFLKVVCVGTGLAGGWLGFMDIVLRHRGYGTIIAATIIAQTLITLAALRYRRSSGLRAAALAGGAVLLWIAVRALMAAFGGAEFEGYILLIAVALIVQVALTLLTFAKNATPAGRRHLN